jgi:hypothetical protein
MQRWVDIYSHLTNEYNQGQNKQADMSTVSSWIVKEAIRHQNDVIVAKPVVVEKSEVKSDEST